MKEDDQRATACGALKLFQVRSASAKGGICRLTLTDLDRQVRDWFKAQVEALGCTVTVDEVGNMFALKPGKRADVAPIAIGSHLDTQPTGGKFDGVLGVLGGLEALRTLHDLGFETNAPLMLVNWTNEEGSRFAPAMLGSGVYAGVFDRTYADSREDRQGVTFKDAIDGIGYRGEATAGSVKRAVSATRTSWPGSTRPPRSERRAGPTATGIVLFASGWPGQARP